MWNDGQGQQQEGYYPSSYDEQQPPNEGQHHQGQTGYFQPPPAGEYNYTAETADYEMTGSDTFPQQQQFQEFSYSESGQGYDQGSQGGFGGYDQQGYGADPQQGFGVPQEGAFFTPKSPYADTPSVGAYQGGATDSFEDEPPLMEELGINLDHIREKTLAVLNPLKAPDQLMMMDTDLAGPLAFCMGLGFSLLLAGKLHFGYIYGIGAIGAIAVYGLLKMMALRDVSISCCVSILGYCLLPMALLSFFAVGFSLKGMLGIVLTAVTVLWCSFSASKLFVAALEMQHQQLLVAYPCALLYGVFALLTVF